MKITLPFLLAIFLSAAMTAQNSIQQKMKEFGATDVGIYYENFKGAVFTHNADEVFHAASTMKVPVMMEVYRQVEKGILTLEQPVLVENEFQSIIDGSLYSLSKEDDSDADLYLQIGQTLPLGALMERMINRSSNLATNLIIQIVKAENVMNLMREIGANDIQVLRGVEDGKAYDAGKNNTTSARALAICLKAISNRKYFHKSSSDQMLSILLSQKDRDGIPAGIKAVDPKLKVANKTGWITEIDHDAAIIQDDGGQSAIMVILTRGVKEEKQGWKLIANLASLLWLNH